MLWEHLRYHGLGMDALVSVCSWHTNVIMVRAWMLWSAYALRTHAISWFEHGCLSQRMLSGTNDIMDATKRLAAIIFSPKFYTLDPKA